MKQNNIYILCFRKLTLIVVSGRFSAAASSHLLGLDT